MMQYDLQNIAGGPGSEKILLSPYNWGGSTFVDPAVPKFSPSVRETSSLASIVT